MHGCRTSASLLDRGAPLFSQFGALGAAGGSRIRLCDEWSGLGSRLSNDEKRSSQHNDDSPGRNHHQVVDVSRRPFGCYRIRSEELRRNHLCRARGRSSDLIRCIAGFRRHRQECDTQLACGDAVSSRTLCQLRGAAFRDSADPGKPDGFLRHSWNGTRAQGRARRKATDDWSRCDAGADIRASPAIQIFAVAQMLASRRCFDPISLTLVAAFLAFAAQLVATSKHFNLHYMLASWVLTGGVLVLTVIETRRLFPRLSPRTIVGSSALVCTVLISTSLLEIRSQALTWIAFNNTGAKLSKAVMTAGPSCANVSGMFVRAPENELNHGADMTLGTPQMEDRFSEAYARAFKVPLLDHNFYRNLLLKNFHPYSYAQLAAEHPCIVVRTSLELNTKTSNGLLELKPDHCARSMVFKSIRWALLARKSG